MKNLFIILSLFLTLNSCVFQEEKFILLDYKDFKTRVNDNNIQFFDVRTPEEYNLGHIKGAVNIDFNNEEVFYKSFNNINKSKPLHESGGTIRQMGRAYILFFISIYFFFSNV